MEQCQKLEKKYIKSKKNQERESQLNVVLVGDNKRLQRICALHHSQCDLAEWAHLDQQCLDAMSRNLLTMSENLLKVRLHKEMDA